VCIEGIEDIDIYTADETTAVQCKYYKGTEYNHSVIGEPIRLMLRHYANNRLHTSSIVKYFIYGHYASGQEKLPNNFDLQFFKEKFLTYSEKREIHKFYEEIGLKDEELIDFKQSLAINIYAPSYEEQEKCIFDNLKTIFSSSDFEAEYYYYNNALHKVKELAVMKDINDRTITRGEFLSCIDKKEILFNIWFMEKKGIDKYYKLIKKEVFSPYNSSPYERFFLIDCDEIISDSELKTLLQIISKKWSKLSQRSPEPFCPYVYFHNVSDDRLTKIKKLLQSDSFYFLDGYDFKGADFFVNSICKQATYYNGIKLKIVNNIDQINEILNSLSTTREIYQLFTKKSFYENLQHKHIKISIVKTSDINAII
jgi:hypothetical protein